MNSQNLIEDGLIRLPFIEQAMQWLVENGPVVENPEVPSWVLKRLVAQQRLLRLRNGVYLAPGPDGVLPPFAALAALLAPTGYVSFHAAFALAGLTDLDVFEWRVVVERPARPVRYGSQRVQFFHSPARVQRAHTTMVPVAGVPVRVATPAEALCDALLFPWHAPVIGELLRVLRNGLAAERIRPGELRAIAEREDTPSFARRLGFLWSLAGGTVDPVLLRIARRTHDRTRASARPEAYRDRTWRLGLPASPEAIAAGARW